MFGQPLAAPQLIQTQASLAALVDDLGRQPRVAVDTESNSLHAYRERVCLLQFSTADADYVVDPLAFDGLLALAPFFANERIEKIFHAAEYDILCLRRDYGFTFACIFDTMQAGRILGRKLAGLDRLLEEKYNLKVSKRLQKANWGARPLSPELLQYAAQDTHYLIPLRDMLEEELRLKGLLELAQEDFRMACNHVANGEAGRGESPSWVRMRGRRDLKPQELTLMKELIEWREQVASRLDRPPFKVVSDEVLLALAKSRPASLQDLEGAGLTSRQIHNWGPQVLAAVERGIHKPLTQRQKPEVPSAVYLQRLDGLKTWRKKAALEMDVESDVILPRGLLLALASVGPAAISQVMGPSPWRLRRFGAEIAAVLAKYQSN